MPYFESSPRLLEFYEALDQNGWFVSFDWVAWDVDAEQYREAPESADLETIAKLLTMYVRQNRFCEGSFASLIEDGHILALLRRLKEIRARM